ncbi:hypothetical protein FQA39_LY06838 [Lamprigera yunnana]|nr:hypothetical protein FQA39_LY06838 [Lamprigera yunnana]
MPLLKQKEFKKVPVPKGLNLCDEVFHCVMTNEIFVDYEEFCQRVILCNSMVWSCTYSGKSGLTFSEALESEQESQDMLKDLPTELHVPLLFFASKTHRTSFSEMADDVHAYVKDRYFVGENVDASFLDNKWKESRILQVIAPTNEKVKQMNANGHTSDRVFYPLASLYSYELEQLDSEDQDITEVMVLKADQIKRRRKFTKDKTRLFLRPHMKQDEHSIFIVKQKVLDDYGISEMKFEKFFDGPLPKFYVSKKLKNARQESITQFLNKSVVNTDKSLTLLEQLRKRKDDFKQLKESAKQQKAEQKLAEKIKQREENNKIAAVLKEWYLPKEDLELEDHKMIPEPTPIESIVPEQYIGDMLGLLEFAHTFSKYIRTKTFFPDGLTFDLVERALLQKEIEGPLIHIIQMLLIAVFNLQVEETNHCSIKIDTSAMDEKVKHTGNDITFTEATYLATKACTWSMTHHGTPLSCLPMNNLNTSEILRLHLLSSGARVNDSGNKWRFQLRGGYVSEDDPALDFCKKQSHILRALAIHNISELPIGNKLKIINCLMNQILTYSDIREFIEDNLEKSRQAKVDLKLLQITDRKQDQEYISAKIKINKEKDINSELNLERLTKHYEQKKTQTSKQMKNLMRMSTKYQNLLGQDRAFRRYFKLLSLPGLLVNGEEDFPGSCLDECVRRIPHLIGADKSAVLTHIHKLSEEFNSSDKENVENKHNENQSDLVKVNGVHHSHISDEEETSSLLMCNAHPEKCVVHSVNRKQNWAFYYEEKHVDDLTKSLNDRGIRENELKQVLLNDKDELSGYLCRTPINMLSPDFQYAVAESDQSLRSRKIVKSKYEESNFGFPNDENSNKVLQSVLIENILDLEENIHSGNIGSLKVKNREVWRQNLTEKNFEFIIKSYQMQKEGMKTASKVKNEGSNSRPNTPDLHNKEYKDPALYFRFSDEISSDDCDFDYSEFLLHTEQHKTSLQALAMALVLVAEGVEEKYLKKPLGQISLKSYTKTLKSNLLEKWKQSLLAASSYSQIFLHYSTLNNCIFWTRSALLAKCQICRKMSDSECMILCDNCNKGQHLFCFRPKLEEVPEGSWYCRDCHKKEDKKKKLSIIAQKPKKRRIFKDESEDDTFEECESSISEELEENESEKYEEQQEEEKDKVQDGKEGGGKENGIFDNEAEIDNKCYVTSSNGTGVITETSSESYDTCNKCYKSGTLLCCDRCPGMYHLDCTEPPLRRVPRGEWLCRKCKVKKNRLSGYMCSNFVLRSDVINNQRHCAVTARNKIHGFARSLRRISESEDSTSGSESAHNRKSKRRYFDLPLNNAPLQEVLAEVLRQECAWPFLRPVVKNEVPDYYDIITKPMDFGTIKYKLNMGNYTCDAELMEDAALVFENCNTYNSADDEVYQCGVKLLKYFVNKCHECGLKVPQKLEKVENREDSMHSAPKKKCID